MRYLAFATDYDGTLATNGRVGDRAIEALERLKASGRKLLMVTGRHLRDLSGVFPRLELFDRVVAENGALLYDPASREEKVLAEAPQEEFLKALQAARVTFDVGRCIVALWPVGRPQKSRSCRSSSRGGWTTRSSSTRAR